MWNFVRPCPQGQQPKLLSTGLWSPYFSPERTSSAQCHSSRKEIYSELCPGHSNTRLIEGKHERKTQGRQPLAAWLHWQPDVSSAHKNQKYFDRKTTRRVFLLFILRNSHHMMSGCSHTQKGKWKIKCSRTSTTCNLVDRGPGELSLKPLQSVFYEWKVRFEYIMTHSGEYSINPH
jgi:hypothetical protein